uniref:Uncharacterized protein n=1 Tax=Vitis vinifera TaxID=29760 RepID=A5ATZ3_VITVI|nr:hypothetical protein VITISV_035764 [Vitis vinifera]
MFEAIQYLVSSKKLENGFGMDNVVVVNSRGKITRSSDENMGLDLQFIHNNIARVLHDFLNDCYGLKMNQTNDFKLLIDVLTDPRAFHEFNMCSTISYYNGRHIKDNIYEAEVKKNVPWRFRFTGEVPHAKTELRSLGSFRRIRELTYSQFSNRCCTDASLKMDFSFNSLSLMQLAMARASHLAFAIQGENWDLNIKYLKQNIKKSRSQISGSTQENFASAQNGCEISQTNRVAAKSFRSQRLIAQPCEIVLQLGGKTPVKGKNLLEGKKVFCYGKVAEQLQEGGAFLAAGGRLAAAGGL